MSRSGLQDCNVLQAGPPDRIFQSGDIAGPSLIKEHDHEEIQAAIFNEPSLKSLEIKVKTFKGDVQLSGFVSSQADINKAVELARSVNGVNSVKNDMRLK